MGASLASLSRVCVVVCFALVLGTAHSRWLFSEHIGNGSISTIPSTARRSLAPSDDKPAWWVLIVIPIIAGFVGWLTNVVALKMTFWPLKFWPQCFAFSQFKGQPIGYLPGWQVRSCPGVLRHSPFSSSFLGSMLR